MFRQSHGTFRESYERGAYGCIALVSMNSKLEKYTTFREDGEVLVPF